MASGAIIACEAAIIALLHCAAPLARRVACHATHARRPRAPARAAARPLPAPRSRARALRGARHASDTRRRSRRALVVRARAVVAARRAGRRRSLALGAGLDPARRLRGCAPIPSRSSPGRDDVLLAGRVDDLDARRSDRARRRAQRALRTTTASRSSRRARRVVRAPPRTSPRSTTTPLDVAAQRPIARAPARAAPTARTWRRWQDEIQMLLHDASGERARARRAARAPVTGIWFWGGGRRRDVPATPGVVCSRRRCAAGDRVRRSRARHARHDGTLPATLDAALDARRAARRRWSSRCRRSPDDASVAAIGERWLAPALAALERGDVAALDLLADGNGATARCAWRSGSRRSRVSPRAGARRASRCRSRRPDMTAPIVRRAVPGRRARARSGGRRRRCSRASTPRAASRAAAELDHALARAAHASRRCAASTTPRRGSRARSRAASASSSSPTTTPTAPPRARSACAACARSAPTSTSSCPTASSTATASRRRSSRWRRSARRACSSRSTTASPASTAWRAAAARGIDVLVTDHHLPGPDAARAGDHRQSEPAGLRVSRRKHLAGVGVMFYVLLALRARLRATGAFAARRGAQPRRAARPRRARHRRRRRAPRPHQPHPGRAGPRAHPRRPRAAGHRGALRGRGPRRAPRDRLRPRLRRRAAPQRRGAPRRHVARHPLPARRRPPPRRCRSRAELDRLNRERRDVEATMQDGSARRRSTRVRRAGDDALHRVPLPAGVAPGRRRHRRRAAQGPLPPAGDRLRARRRRRAARARAARSPASTCATRSTSSPSARPARSQRFGGHAFAAGSRCREARCRRFAAAFEEVARDAAHAGAPRRGTVDSDGALGRGELTLELAPALARRASGARACPAPTFDDVFDVASQRRGRRARTCASRSSARGERFEAIAVPPGRAAARRGSAPLYRPEVNEWNGRRVARARRRALAARRLTPVRQVASWRHHARASANGIRVPTAALASDRRERTAALM